MNHYYNGYDGPDEAGYYKGLNGIRGMERMGPTDQTWEAARAGRETSPRDMEQPLQRYMNERLVKIVGDCESSCEYMAMYVLSLPDFRSRTTQAELLRDCADICGIAAKVLARNSISTGQISALCARICINCGNECAKFSDAMSQQCSRICLETAGLCADFTTL